MVSTIRNICRYIWGKINKKEEEPERIKYTFYDTIEEFGYHFNENGQLVNEQGGPFVYHVREGDSSYNQQHYDALGEVVAEYIYKKLESDLHFQQVYIPVDPAEAEPQSFFFQTPDAATNPTLMVIITGAGVVRAGQWSRKLILNEGLEIGSQLPYIRRALDLGYAVMVLNTNLNEQEVDGNMVEIRGSSKPEEHGQYVWEHFVSKTKATNIVIVAHSYGGVVTCTLIDKFLKDFEKRVFCIVFTDSVHIMMRDKWSNLVKQFLRMRALNFASVKDIPVDYIMITSHPEDCLAISAGTSEHERTSHSCIDSVFRFISENHATWVRDGSMAPRCFKPLPEDLTVFTGGVNRWEEFLAQKRRENAAAIAEGKSESKKRGFMPWRKENSSSSKKGRIKEEKKFASWLATQNPEDALVKQAKESLVVKKTENAAEDGREEPKETETAVVGESEDPEETEKAVEGEREKPKETENMTKGGREDLKETESAAEGERKEPKETESGVEDRRKETESAAEGERKEPKEKESGVEGRRKETESAAEAESEEPKETESLAEGGGEKPKETEITA